MVSYGLKDELDDDSFDIPPQLPQPRKRSYPNAFPEEEGEQGGSRDELYPHISNTSIPVAVGKPQEWLVALGLRPGLVMDCLTTAFGSIKYVIVEYGGKLFNAGTLLW